jgi:hypothetical protein
MQLVADENLSFIEGPSYILVILGSSLVIYLLLLIFWIINTLQFKNVLKKNVLHSTLTAVFIMNLIIHSYGLGMMIWIETESTEESYIWGMTGLDAYVLMKLFLTTMIFIVQVLISRGWCITKEADALNHLDRQLLFLQTLGITFANVLATNYMNKIGVISLALIYSVVFRVMELSVERLIRSLKVEIDCLLSSSRNIPVISLT